MVDLSKLSDAELEAQIAAAQGQGSAPVMANAPPSTWEDIKNVAGPALARGALQLGTVPGSLADLAVAGAQKAAGAVGAPNAEKYLGGIRQQYTEPASYGGQMRQLQQSWPEANAQAQTTGGKFAQTGLEFAPSVLAAGLTGGESLLPTMVKGAASAAGSEGAGELAEKYQNYLPEWAQPYASPVSRMVGALGGWMGPGTLRAGVTPSPTTPLRSAQTATVREAGVPVDTAQATGSPRQRKWLGPAPNGQDDAVSQAMLRAGGVQVPEGVPVHPRDFVNARGPALSQEGQGLATQAPMQVDNTLTTALSNRVQQYAATSASDAPAVQEQLDRFNAMHGNGMVNSISGPQYWQLRNEWTSSVNPIIRRMGSDIDSAMDRTLAGGPLANRWGQWRQNWADYQGLKAAADEAAAKGTTTLNPTTVFSNIERETPLKNLAQSAIAVTKPIEPAGTSKMAAGLGMLGGAALNARHSGGVSEGIIAGGLGAPWAIDAAARMARPALKTPPVSTYLENQLWRPSGKYGGGYPGQFGTLDPQTAARLLALQSASKVPATAQTPQ